MADSDVKQTLAGLSGFSPAPITDEEIRREIVARRGRQDLSFRAMLFWIVVPLMFIEVVLMFLLAFLQGATSFELDKWVLVAIEGGVLLQTFGLARIITKALFSER